MVANSSNIQDVQYKLTVNCAWILWKRSGGYDNEMTSMEQ